VVVNEFELQQLKEKVDSLDAFVGQLREAGLDRLAEWGYVQFEGAPIRIDNAGIQVEAPSSGGVGTGINGLFFMPALSPRPGLINDSTAVFPRSAVTGFATASVPQTAIYLAADAVFNKGQARVYASSDANAAESALQAINPDNSSGSIASLTIRNPDGGPATAVLELNGETYDLTAGGGGMSLIVKEADQTINTDATLNDDAELLFAVGANEVYQFEGVLMVEAANATMDFRMSFTGPVGAVGSFFVIGADTASGNADAGSDALGGTATVISTAAIKGVRFWGGIHNGATAGNLTLQWAQSTSDGGNLTVRAGSYMKWQLES
jgi:hypothetical protein